MASSRRKFLERSAIGIGGVAAAKAAEALLPPAAATQLPPGSPPVFGGATPVGPPVSATTIAEAEKLAQVQYRAAEREEAAANWREAMAPLYERRTGPKKVALEATLSPATVWNPALPGLAVGPAEDRLVRSRSSTAPLPARDADIAFAPVTALSRWIESRALSSERLTRIYLERLARFDPKLRCAITISRHLALEQAGRAH